MAEAVIGLGSNLGNGRRNLRQAWQRLGEHPAIRLLRLSSPYETAPVEMESPQWFTNAAGLLETELSPAELLAEMADIERAMGRVRGLSRDRAIDLDLLFYGQLVQSETVPLLPHPRIQDRRFVLAPVAEIVPNFFHPVLRQTVAQLLQRLGPAGQEVRKTSWEAQGALP